MSVNTANNTANTDKPDFRINLAAALKSLQQEDLIAYNSDKGWFVACDACSEKAVNVLIELLPNAPKADTALLIDSTVRIQSYTDTVSDIVWDLFEVSDDKISIVLENTKNLASQISIKAPKTGFRISSDTFASHLIQRFRKPLFCIIPLDSEKVIKALLAKQSFHLVEHNRTKQIKLQHSSIIKIGAGNQVEIIRN